MTGVKGMVSQLLHTLAIILKSPMIPGEEVDNALLEDLNTSVFQYLSHPWAERIVQSKHGRRDSSKKSLLHVLHFLSFLSNSGMKFRKKARSQPAYSIIVYIIINDGKTPTWPPTGHVTDKM